MEFIIGELYGTKQGNTYRYLGIDPRSTGMFSDVYEHRHLFLNIKNGIECHFSSNGYYNHYMPEQSDVITHHIKNIENDDMLSSQELLLFNSILNGFLEKIPEDSDIKKALITIKDKIAKLTI